MIQEFQIQNFFSIRERQTLSFLPTNDDKMRSQYLYEVAEGVELLKIGIVYGSNASGKTTLLDALFILPTHHARQAGKQEYGNGVRSFSSG